MKIVTAPLDFEPHECLVTGRSDSELIDFERDCVGFDPHVYIRKDVVEQAAIELCGMLPAKEVESLKEQVEALGAQIEALSDFVSTLDNFDEQLDSLLTD